MNNLHFSSFNNLYYNYLRSLCDCKIKFDVVFGAAEALYHFNFISLDEYSHIIFTAKVFCDCEV